MDSIQQAKLISGHLLHKMALIQSQRKTTVHIFCNSLNSYVSALRIHIRASVYAWGLLLEKYVWKEMREGAVENLLTNGLQMMLTNNKAATQTSQNVQNNEFCSKIMKS